MILFFERENETLKSLGYLVQAEYLLRGCLKKLISHKRPFDNITSLESKADKVKKKNSSIN